MVFPRIQPTAISHCSKAQGIDHIPPVVQCEYIPFLQYSQVAQDDIHDIKTCSPFLNALTDAPTSSTMPTPSCPRIVPGWQVATSPFEMWRSVPQMVDLVSFMIASVGPLRVGLGLSSSFTLPSELLYTRAFMVE